MLNSECPLPVVIEDLVPVDCAQTFGQIQKLAIRFIEDEDTTYFTEGSSNGVLDKDLWLAAIVSHTKTKIVITPSIPGIVIPNSELIQEEGGNNNTLNGMPIPVGKGNVKVTGKPLNMPVASAKSIENLMKYSNVSGVTLIEAFFFNEAGQIICQNTPNGNKMKGFPIYNLFVSSVGSEGLNKSNTHVISFEMRGNWDDNLMIISPVTSPDALPASWNPLKL